MKIMNIYIFMILLILLLIINIISGHQHHINKTKENGWLFDQKIPFVIPNKVTIGLIGFDGDGYKSYHLDTDILERYLRNSLESHIPACVECKDYLNVQFDLSYNIIKLPKSQIINYENNLVKNLKFVAKRTEDSFYYDVNVEDMNDILDEYYQTLFNNDNNNIMTNAIIIINPEARRMKPPKVNGQAPREWSYRYRYNGATPTQAWIAKEKYLVVDLAAGPTEFGVTNAGEGTVSMESIPNLDMINESKFPRHNIDPSTEKNANDALELSNHIKFLAQMSSLVITAVRSVFLPDLRFKNIEAAEKVVIPIMVFRNHDRYNPLNNDDKTSPFYIDLELIENELTTLLAPNQELKFTSSLFDLHDHRQIYTALFRSMRSDSIHTATPSGHYVAKTMAYFDSAVLIDELSRVEDILTKAYMNHDANYATGKSAIGHRLLPVYVFSLLGFPKDMMLDRRHLHITTKSCVIVLQTPSEHVFVPYFNEDGILSVDARQVTKQILAGTVSSFSGVMHPYEKFIVQDNMMVADYIWANGHHPFGPFTKTNGISKIYIDITRRNNLLSRITSSFSLIRETMNIWDDFTREYIFDPLGDTIQYTTGSTTLTPIQLMANKLEFWHLEDEENAPLSKEVMARLLQETSELETQFARLAQLLRNNEWNDADILSNLLEKLSNGFSKYAHEEIAAARRNLRCCQRVHKVVYDAQETRNRYFKWILIAICGIGVYVLVQSGMKSSTQTTTQTTKFTRTRRY